MIRRARFWLTHLVPRTHVSSYTTDGQRWLSVWRQWGTHVWAHEQHRLTPA